MILLFLKINVDLLSPFAKRFLVSVDNLLYECSQESQEVS